MTAPTDPHRTLDAATIAELNDLLQVDHDAVAAYSLAARGLANVGRRETVMRFRGDHERHIELLTNAIRRAGGTPLDRVHAADGAFARAMRGLGAGGGDRAVIAAFVANEAQTCEKYTRAATRTADWPAELRDLVATAADDEARHYEWAEDQLASFPSAVDAAAARVAQAADTARSRLAEGAERLEATVKRGREAARRSVRVVRERLPERMPELELPRPSRRALTVAAVSAAVGFGITFAIAQSARRRS